MSYLTVLKHKYKWPNQSGFISALKPIFTLYLFSHRQFQRRKIVAVHF